MFLLPHAPTRRVAGRPGVPWLGQTEIALRHISCPLLPADCRGGLFGPGCALRCDCGGGADCDPITGQCHCVDGYTGPTCRQGESGSQGRGRRTPCPQAHPWPRPCLFSPSLHPTRRVGWARLTCANVTIPTWYPWCPHGFWWVKCEPYSHWTMG